ncbi:MAG: tetratricopeptide repeat protein [Pirellulales bacterium]|nr:tetratricopeptide repeat protein [Pirellulales bacterium]
MTSRTQLGRLLGALCFAAVMAGMAAGQDEPTAPFPAGPAAIDEALTPADEQPQEPAPDAADAAGDAAPEDGAATTAEQDAATPPAGDEAPADEAAPLDQPASEAEAPATPEARLQQAYELSKTAKTAAELTRMIELCDSALAANLEGQFARYGKQLISWAHNERGEVLAEQGRGEEALADFEKSLQYDSTRWKALHNRAISYALAGLYDQSLADFDATIKLKPNYANAYFNRGELLYDRGEYQQAVEDYSRAIRLAPRDSEAYNSRGHAWYKQGNFDRAVADYNRALQLEPENAAAYVNRGDTYADRGQYGQAASDYRAAIRINPNLGRAYQSTAWLMATCPDERFRHREHAVTAAKKALELDGENYRYLDTLAAAYANAGDYATAAQTVTSAIQQAPPDTAEVYQTRLGEYEANRPWREARGGSRRSTVAQSRRANAGR